MSRVVPSNPGESHAQISHGPLARPRFRTPLELERLEGRLLLSGATVYVDDDFTALTPGWGVDHFDSIQAGIAAAAGQGCICAATGRCRARDLTWSGWVDDGTAFGEHWFDEGEPDGVRAFVN